MSKFKIGDKVRRIEKYYKDDDDYYIHNRKNWETVCQNDGLKPNTVVTIRELGDNNQIYIDELTGWGYWDEEKFELIEDIKFEIGDKVKFIGKKSGNDIPNYTYDSLFVIHGMTKLGKEYNTKFAKIVGFYSDLVCVDYPTDNLEGHTCLDFKKSDIELVNPKKLNKTMEIDEIKKIDKSVLAEANKEVLEEIDNELKVIAKKKLRELYNKKKLAEQKSDEASSELKELTKDLKSLTTK